MAEFAVAALVIVGGVFALAAGIITKDVAT